MAKVSDELSRVYDNILQGDIITASMLAQEILADILSQWNKCSINSESASGDLADSLLLAFVAYAETLLKQQQPRAAYNAVMNGLAYTVVADAVADESRLMALVSAWNAVEQDLAGSAPDNQQHQTDVGIVAQGLASLIYKYYYKVGRANPDSTLLQDAYDTLRVLSSLVCIDTGEVDDKKVLSSVLKASHSARLIE